MMVSIRRLCFASLVSTLVSAIAGSARAEPPEEAVAQPIESAAQLANDLFQRSQKLMSKGRYQDACVLLAASSHLHPDINSDFRLAECERERGKTATAYHMFLRITEAATELGNKAQADFARDTAVDLKPRVPRLKLIIDVPREARNSVVIELDGTKIDIERAREVLYVDPGTHSALAYAPGLETTSTIFTAKSGELAKVTLRIRAPVPPSVSVVDDEPAESGGSSVWQVAGGGFIGGGLVAMGVGLAVGIMAKSIYDDSTEYCRDADDTCSPEAIDLQSEAVALGNVGTGLIVGGAAFTAGGLSLVLLTRSSSSSDDSASFGAAFTPQSAEFIVHW